MRYNISSEGGVYSVTSALTVGGRRQPRSRCVGLTDTIVTRADWTQYVIPRNTRTPSSARASRRTPIIAREPRKARMTAADMAPIQNYEGDN